MLKIFRSTFFFFDLLLWLISLVLNDLNVMFISIIAILVHNITYSFENLQKRIIFFAFQVTFFTFLLGKTTLSFILGEGFKLDFEQEIVKHIFIALFLSLLFTFIGYVFSEKQRSNENISDDFSEQYSSYNRKVIKNISKWIFYISYGPYLILLLEKVIFVRKTSYLSYYMDFQTNIPFVLVKIGEMSVISFFVFLASMPSKKECKVPVLLYLGYGIISLGYGQRNQFVLNILIIVIYYFFRNTIKNSNEKWIKKKDIIIGIALIPFLISFLGMFGYVRVDKKIENFSFSNAILDFFDSQGGSISLIGYGEQFKDAFPENKIYSLGPIIDFLKNNIFSNLIFKFPQLKGNTIEMALQGNSFGQTITYLVMPNNYLNGIGLGSCYIAEIYKDFGYLGICAVNFIYGFVFAKLYKLCKSNIWLSALGFIIIKDMLYSPRDAALSFIMSCLNLINILTITLIFVLYKMYVGKRKKVSIF